MKIVPAFVKDLFKPSIARRTALTLTVFGVLMGYFSFVMLFVIGTGDIIQIASKRFEESIYSLFPDKDGDSIMRLLASRDPKVVDSIRIFEKVASGITSI